LAEVTTTVKRLEPNLLIIGNRPLLEDDAMSAGKTVPFGPQELVDAIKPWITVNKHS
jgi:hypothetical protein